MLMFATFGTHRLPGRLRRTPRRRRTGTAHRDRAAAPARRVRQVRAAAAAVLAPGRDGGPDPGVGAHPRRDDGDRGRLPDRPLRARSSSCRADAQLVVTIVGAATLLFGAIIGCAKDDIKKALAGSTMSQIGYMVLAAGLGRGRLRLRDRAPHRARLLQGGPVPRRRLGHARHERRGRHAQLRRAAQGHADHLRDVRARLPRHHRLPAACPAASPRTASSRPRSTRAARPGRSSGWRALLGAGITAYYMSRVMFMTFFGEKRWDEDAHPHESPKVMTLAADRCWRSARSPRAARS